MGFKWKHLLGLLPLVLLTGNLAAAGSREQVPAEITVVVNDSARVSPAVLSQAEREAGRIFDAAGIAIQWVNCGRTVGDDRCSQAPGADQFMLHIVPKGKTTTDMVFGVAFLGEDGGGKYCNVFFDRVREGHRDLGTSTPLLLGTVAAHELGHLLLGSHAHSKWGIMEPVWHEEALRQTGMGTFLFTAEQGALMRARIGREGTVVAGWGRVRNSGPWSVISGR